MNYWHKYDLNLQKKFIVLVRRTNVYCTRVAILLSILKEYLVSMPRVFVFEKSATFWALHEVLPCNWHLKNLHNLQFDVTKLKLGY